MTEQAGSPFIDVPRRSGAAAIGARLRQLSDRVDREASAAYESLGLRFDQRGYGVVSQLAAAGRLNVGELARRLGISHPAVSQIRRRLEAEGLVRALSSAGDGRRTDLELTAAGRRLATLAAPLWHALEAVSRDLDAEAGAVVDRLLRLEQALDERCIAERVARLLSGPKAAADAD